MDGAVGDRVRLQLAANPSWGGELKVIRFEGEERLSACFEWVIEVAGPSSLRLDPAGVLGQEAVVTLALRQGGERSFHGLVTELKGWSLGPGAWQGRHRLSVRPRLWTLGRNQRLRVFQNLTTEEIVAQVLREGAVEHDWRLHEHRPAREYCVQYRESDLSFISRLLEEEGIFYYFLHEPTRHLLVLGDAPACYEELPDGSVLPFLEDAGAMARRDHVHDLGLTAEMQPDAVVLRDWNPFMPEVDLEARFGNPESTSLEVYDYPGLFEDNPRGEYAARMLGEAYAARRHRASGGTNCHRLGAGRVFSILGHPAQLDDEKLLVLRAFRQLTQPLPDASPEAGPPVDHLQFEAQPATTPFRPLRTTPRPVIAGTHTAVVTGPPGEEIHTDAYGRVKVKFPWDRAETQDESTSCWVRVGQSWAGPGFGTLFLPRVGQEVVVSFLEGDPDRPVIIGAVYSAASPPPIPLPAEATRSILRTASSPGGRGHNEIAFEDAADRELFSVRAERDLEEVVGRHRTLTVGGTETIEIAGQHSRTVGGSEMTLVEGSDETTVRADQRLSVGLARTVSVGGDLSETIGGAVTAVVGGAITLEVGQSARETVAQGRSLTVGGNQTVSIKGALREEVGGPCTLAVAGARAVTVGGDVVVHVGGAHQLQVADRSEETVGALEITVAGDLTSTVAGSRTETTAATHRIAAREVVIDAQDLVRVRVGSATLELSKDGKIQLNGKQVTLNATGDLLLRGKRITEN